MNERERLAKLEELKKLRSEYRLLTYHPYDKQMRFHSLPNRERGLFGANQGGKTMAGGMEVAMHATGIYPDWWKGRKFKKAVRWGVGSETGDLLKKGPQRVLYGTMEAPGTGTIPKPLLVTPPKMSRGTPDGIDTLQVRHCTNGVPDGSLSALVFMSYADGRAKWASDVWDGAWFDEEPPIDIYTEGMTRTNTSMGPVMLTMSPLNGMSDVALRFVNKDGDADMVTMPIMETDHFKRLSPEDQQRWLNQYPSYERDARLYGRPIPGQGKIFKFEEEIIKVAPFEIPKHYAIIGGMDFGIDHPFAAVRLAKDPETEMVYVTHAYRQRGLTPIGHASALRNWGQIPWAWPHDGLQRDKQSGKQLAQFYRDEGLSLLSEFARYPDDRGNGLEASITDMNQRMERGLFHVFSHLEEWFEEYRFYHRKLERVNGIERSVPVPVRDDLLSATRYAVMMLRYAEIVQPLQRQDRYSSRMRQRRSWLAA